jgi:uncharacterized protein DUF3501
MEPIGLADILGRERYGAQRDAIRRRIIAHKRARRVAVGDRVSLVFEDRATIWYQTQEMLWVESVTDLDAVRAELEVYNALLPGPHELSATLLIEIEDRSRMRDDLNRLVGIDEHLLLEVGDERKIAGRFEPGRQTAEKISAVQYVRFPLTDEAQRDVASGRPLALAIVHPSYRARAVVPEPVRASLAADLADPRAADAALRRVRDGD